MIAKVQKRLFEHLRRLLKHHTEFFQIDMSIFNIFDFILFLYTIFYTNRLYF